MSAVVEQVEYVSVERSIPMRRVWAMPNKNTFDIPPIRALVRKYLRQSKVSIDPYVRNSRLATYTNDLNPDTAAEYHLEATSFLQMLVEQNQRADMMLFDPPYSLRQVKEVYAGIGQGLPFSTSDGWGYKTHRDLMAALLLPAGVCLSFGWNSIGLGVERGFEIIEILLVSHGREHNDTICTVERKIESAQLELLTSRFTATHSEQRQAVSATANDL